MNNDNKKNIWQIIWNALEKVVHHFVKTIGLSISSQIRKLRKFYFYSIEVLFTSNWYKENIGDVTYTAVENAYLFWVFVSFIFKCILFIILGIFIFYYCRFALYVCISLYEELLLLFDYPIQYYKFLKQKLKKKIKVLDEKLIKYLERFE